MAELRRCIGSAKFGIEPHEAPIGDFPKQPSQTDGLGRMCRVHWNQYTTALRKAADARKAAEAIADGAPVESEAEEPTVADATEGPEPTKPKRGRQRSEPAAEAEQEGRSRVDRPAQANTRALGASPEPFYVGRAASRSRDVPR